jgi:hypothetical protein
LFKGSISAIAISSMFGSETMDIICVIDGKGGYCCSHQCYFDYYYCVVIFGDDTSIICADPDGDDDFIESETAGATSKDRFQQFGTPYSRTSALKQEQNQTQQRRILQFL